LSRHPLFKPYVALAAVCFFWGTTYLGIRMSLEMFPPLTLVAVRYLISGALTLAFAWYRGLHIPRGKELAAACIAGSGNAHHRQRRAGGLRNPDPQRHGRPDHCHVAVLDGGSGSAAARRREPARADHRAMALGLAGAALLVTPGAEQGAGHSLLVGFLVLQLGMAGWSFGSIYQRRNAGKAHPVVAGGIHQLAAGLAMAPFAWLVPHQPIHWSTRGVARCSTWWSSVRWWATAHSST
jgi:drug/metabolite transporter (DMT)-like permease